MADDIDAGAVASREDKDELARSDAEFVRGWLDEIEIASKEEEDWRASATKAVNVFRSNSPEGSNEKRERTFNILYSNVETTVPALYNSMPVPDVRRRFGDDDPIAREISELIERVISYSIDSYDFDQHMRAAVYDQVLPGRGVTRVRYVPYFGQNENLAYEEAVCEHVPWKHFRRGAGRMWDDVRWVAFELFLTREQLRELAPDVADKINLDCVVEGYKEKDDGSNIADIFKRAKVWEIWDKDSRQVIFIAPSFGEEPITVQDDPLGLFGFFPVPRPLYAIETSDTLIPIAPYTTYQDQAEELEEVSQRIFRLTKALKARGVYDSRMSEMGSLTSAEDNELIPVENAALFAEGGSVDKAISWWPIQVIVAVLKELYVQRDQIKNSIFEISGLADIMRGASNPNETLGAQQIKTQWGSLRVQRLQAEVQRYARDLFRIKSEIIAGKFSFETIEMMTGQKFPTAEQKQMVQAQMQQMQAAQQPQQPGGPPPGPQGGNVVPARPQVNPAQMKQMQEMMEKPTREEIEQVLRHDLMRAYRIDVETDSTVRGDMTRNIQAMTQFLQGTAQYLQAVGPMVLQGVMGAPEATDIFSSFARQFRLGKQAEDALDRLKKKAEDYVPPKQGEDQAKAQQEELALKKQEAEQRVGIERERLEIDKQRLAIDQQGQQARLQMDQADMQAKREMEARQLELGLHDIEIKKQDITFRQAAEADRIGFERERFDEEKKRSEFDQVERKSRLRMDRKKTYGEMEVDDPEDEMEQKVLDGVMQAVEASTAASDASRQGVDAMVQAVMQIAESIQQSTAEMVRMNAEAQANQAAATQAIGEMMIKSQKDSQRREDRIIRTLTAPKRTVLIKDDAGKPVGSMTEALN